AVHDVFSSPRLEAVLREARAQYDYVALDTPPVVPVSDCRMVVPWVDGLLLVVSAHRTPRRLVEASLNLLDSSRVLGIVFNRDDRQFSGSHRRYYNRRATQAVES